MDLKIGSFNVLNLKKDTSNPKDQSEEKEKKCQKIANIISAEDIDLIALQEILDNGAVKLICKNLPGYCFCHCSNLYDSLNSAGFHNRHGQKFKSDYAYIWNTRKIGLCNDLELYKKLELQTSKCWERFIDSLILLLVDLQNSSAKHIPIFSGLPNGIDLKNNRELFKAILRQTLRPPLIACFRPTGGWKDLSWEIRMINTHTQWKSNKPTKKQAASMTAEQLDSEFLDTETDLQIRKKEMKYIQGELYTAVNTCRMGDNRTVYTLVAGDFNMSVKQTRSIYEDADFYHENHEMGTIQEDLSTWSKSKKIFINSYDHFAFDHKRISAAAIKVIKPDDEQFYVDIKDPKSRISDHNPIQMIFTI